MLVNQLIALQDKFTELSYILTQALSSLSWITLCAPFPDLRPFPRFSCMPPNSRDQEHLYLSLLAVYRSPRPRR